jgi:hypothetical protein
LPQLGRELFFRAGSFVCQHYILIQTNPHKPFQLQTP